MGDDTEKGVMLKPGSLLGILQITLIVSGQQTRRRSFSLASLGRLILPSLIRLTIREKKPNKPNTPDPQLRQRLLVLVR
jgi:hypothetical protein